jgi:peroxiredoxin
MMTLNNKRYKSGMKRIFFMPYLMVFFMIFTFTHCAEAQKKKKGEDAAMPASGGNYVLKGRFTGEIPTGIIQVKDWTRQMQMIVDSLVINTKDSTFEIRGEADQQHILFLFLDPRMVVPVVVEKGTQQTVEIHLTKQGLRYDVKGNGSSHSESLRQFLEQKSRFDYDIYQLEQMSRNQQVNPADFEKLRNSYMNLTEARGKLAETFIAGTEEPMLAYFIMREFMGEEASYPTYTKIISLFEKKAPGAPQLEEIKQKFASERATMIGAEAPDIRLPTPQGDTLSLSSLRGKVVLIDFWASWCRPCRVENPEVKKLYEKFKSKGFEIYAVSLDGDKASWEGAIRQDGLTWKHVSDLQKWGSQAARLYKVSGIPYTVLLDEKGNILAKNLRSHALGEFLTEYFK